MVEGLEMWQLMLSAVEGVELDDGAGEDTDRW